MITIEHKEPLNETLSMHVLMQYRLRAVLGLNLQKTIIDEEGNKFAIFCMLLELLLSLLII
jgi:hypothetical protein